MTCQHCQTWVGNEEHRCGRCGRRVRAVPNRISPSTYPIAATATAHAYDFDVQPQAPVRQQPAAREAVAPSGQQQLFTEPVNPPRVISFDSLTSPAERESIRVRSAELVRPPAVRNERVELPRPTTRRRSKGYRNENQRALEFFGEEEIVQAPQISTICDAPVASAVARSRAALIDGTIIAVGCLTSVILFHLAGGSLSLDRHLLPFLIAALTPIPLFYKALWAFAGQDSIGLQKVGLKLVDFDGNPPSRVRRYQRLAGGVISLLAAGVGLIWSFVDEDRLTWHDHISGTFPTYFEGC